MHGANLCISWQGGEKRCDSCQQFDLAGRVIWLLGVKAFAGGEELPGLGVQDNNGSEKRTAVTDNDGLLTASKIATLKFNADWVVLSACNTAAGDGTPNAGGFSGLAKAVFYAGARSLLVSHWSVPSAATVKLTTGAFAELAKNPGIGRAEAFRRSMMAMLDPSNPPEFSHPAAWAPFSLVGEGGAGK